MQTPHPPVTRLTPQSQEILPFATGKTSFLVFKHNKYFIVPTENIAFFYLSHETTSMVCFNLQEYSVSYSLENIQKMMIDKQFFRLNRQYLVSFRAIKEVERCFARKLKVNLIVPAREQLLVSKEKLSNFLHWLDNR